MAAAGLIGAAYLLLHFATPHFFVNDDGAITLRYASRIASAGDFRYSEYASANGASSPMWTLVLAGLLWLGLTCGKAVLAFGNLAFVATAYLGSRAALTESKRVAAFVFVLCFLALPNFYTLHFTGLESGLSLLTIAATAFAMGKRRFVMLGALLGFAFASKVDGLAGMGALFVWCVLRRDWRELRRSSLGFALVAVPLLIVVQCGFGSVLTNSATSKFVNHGMRPDFDPTWLVSMLFAKWGLMAWPCTLAVLAGLFQLKSQVRFVLSLWCVVHVLFYSLVNLGDTFPWYSAVPFFLGVLVLAISCGALLAKAPRKFSIATPAILLVLLLPSAIPTWHRLFRIEQDQVIPPNGKIDLARQMAGTWLKQNATPGELLMASHGYPSLAYEGPVYDLSGLNSVQDFEYSLTSTQLIANPKFQAEALAGRLATAAIFDFGPEPWTVYSANISPLGERGDFTLASVLAPLNRLPHQGGLSVPTPRVFTPTGTFEMHLRIPNAMRANLCPDLVPTATHDHEGGRTITVNAGLTSAGFPCLLHARQQKLQAFATMGPLPTIDNMPVMFERWRRFLAAYGFE